METFSKRFGSLLAFVYHCFDRIGYISRCSRCSRVPRTGFIVFGTCTVSTQPQNLSLRIPPAASRSAAPWKSLGARIQKPEARRQSADGCFPRPPDRKSC